MRAGELASRLLELPDDAEVELQTEGDDTAPIALVGGLPGADPPIIIIYHSP